MKGLKIYRMTHHQNKENAFKRALLSRGWHESQYRFSQYVSFGLFDGDWPSRKSMFDELNGKPWFLYPHAARPMVQYDGCVEPRRDCRAMFVSAPAGVYLMQKIGYPCEVVEVGWSLCPIKRFFPRATADKITYAPIHPNANTFLSEVDKRLNAEAYRRLVRYAERHESTVTVRYVRDIRDNGLAEAMAEAHPNFIWKQATPDGSTDDITRADLVVAHQTFAYMSVALGVPTLMIGEDVPPRSGNSEAGFTYVQHWDDYKDYMIYPLDILDEDVDETVQMAIESDEPIRDWKAAFIGQPFDGDKFVDAIEERL